MAQLFDQRFGFLFKLALIAAAVIAAIATFVWRRYGLSGPGSMIRSNSRFPSPIRST